MAHTELPPARPRWHDVRWWVPVVALLLALHAWLALSAVEHMGPTADEPLHLISGYTYWRLNDYRMQPENGNLPQRWAGATMMFDHTPPRLPKLAGNPEWTRTQCPWFCDSFSFYEGNPYYFYLFRARAAMLAFSLGLGLLIFHCSRRLWGPAGGCFSLALYCLEPCFLANAPLVTSDLCATFFLVAATLAYAWSLQKPSWRRTLGSGLVLGLACVAKFSAVLLGPIFAVLAVLSLALGGDDDERVIRRIAKVGASALVQILIAWAIIWTFLGWRYAAANPALPPMEKFVISWDVIDADLSLRPHLLAVVSFLRAHHLFPQNYLYGVCNVIYGSEIRAAFLNGARSATGWWYFFPFAFVMKTTLAAMCAFVAALVIGVRAALARRKAPTFSPWLKTWTLRLAPFVVFFVVYWAAALTSHLNIGQRHILPVYPALFVMAGLLLHRRAQRAARIFACVLLAGLAVESFSVRPHYLAFFNQLVGGPSQGYQHLADSSLDWGQDLPVLVDWLRTHRQPREPVYLAYMGTDSIIAEGVPDAQIISPIIPYHEPYVFHELKPGLYCIGATMLDLVYTEPWSAWDAETESKYENLARVVATAQANHYPIPHSVLLKFDHWRFSRLCLYLRTRKPTAVLGYDMFVYRLTEPEISAATRGSLWDLVKAIEAPQ